MCTSIVVPVIPKPKKPSKAVLVELSDLEKAIYRKVSEASFPPATASKRFMQGDPELVKLSDKGRSFLAFIANRFRRQYMLTEEEWAWVNQWNSNYDGSKLPNLLSQGNLRR